MTTNKNYNWENIFANWNKYHPWEPSVDEAEMDGWHKYNLNQKLTKSLLCVWKQKNATKTNWKYVLKRLRFSLWSILGLYKIGLFQKIKANNLKYEKKLKLTPKISIN